MGLYRFPVTGILVCALMIIGVSGHPNYREALSKSILFFEGQRSGKLPANQRITWRSDSGLSDGSPENVDLSGGYYVGGDNTKFSYPMAYSITMLAWSVIEYGNYMGNDLHYAREAIRWGSDYLLKTCSRLPTAIYYQVGDSKADHECWQRAEDIDAPKKLYKVTPGSTGSNIAAEIAAALAAASIVFKEVDPRYSTTLLETAKEAYEFSENIEERTSPLVCQYYCPQDATDEQEWGAAWLFKATGNVSYFDKLDYIESGLWSSTPVYWQFKLHAVRVLLSKYYLIEEVEDLKGILTKIQRGNFKRMAQGGVFFICSLLPESTDRETKYTTGGLMEKMNPTKMQFVTSTTFLFITFANYLEKSKYAKDLSPCGYRVNVGLNSTRLIEHAKRQADYILGENKYGLSYMVGFGEKFPKRIHHRGSSLPSVKQNPQHIGCKDGFSSYLSVNPNPNILTGAIVGGPDEHDKYFDNRKNSSQSEPGTYINAPFVGTLAYLASRFNSS